LETGRHCFERAPTMTTAGVDPEVSTRNQPLSTTPSVSGRVDEIGNGRQRYQ
jgi:hypothetical protein